MKLRIVIFAAALLCAGAAQAQLSTPSAEDAVDAPDAAAPKKAKKPTAKREAPAADDAAKPEGKKGEPTSAVASIVGKTLKLNGATGQMEIAKGDDKDKPLKIMTLKISGEVISNPQQKCEISIVGDGPIALSRQGAPDGLPRFAADVPACPISFDVVEGGVIVPPQTQACVFQAADCQASPSGVWGPEAAALADQAKTLANVRTRAEASISESLKTLAKRSKGEDAELQKEQSDFNALRDETCRHYQGESTHGYCDARLTQARAALLHKQVAKAPHKEKAKE